MLRIVALKFCLKISLINKNTNQFKTQLFEMPYFSLTAENTYFIVFNITCKNEALLYIVEYIHTNRRFRLLHRLEFAQWFLNVRLFTKTSLLKEGRKKNQQMHRLPPEHWHSL